MRILSSNLVSHTHCLRRSAITSSSLTAALLQVWLHPSSTTTFRLYVPAHGMVTSPLAKANLRHVALVYARAGTSALQAQSPQHVAPAAHTAPRVALSPRRVQWGRMAQLLALLPWSSAYHAWQEHFVLKVRLRRSRAHWEATPLAVDIRRAGSVIQAIFKMKLVRVLAKPAVSVATAQMGRQSKFVVQQARSRQRPTDLRWPTARNVHSVTTVLMERRFRSRVMQGLRAHNPVWETRGFAPLALHRQAAREVAQHALVVSVGTTLRRMHSAFSRRKTDASHAKV
jgi:hypothetical protein